MDGGWSLPPPLPPCTPLGRLLLSCTGPPLFLKSTLGSLRETTGLGMRDLASSPGPASPPLRPQANPLCAKALNISVQGRDPWAPLALRLSRESFCLTPENPTKMYSPSSPFFTDSVH